MTIKELKEIIRDLPSDILVYIADSEYGPEECTGTEIEEVPRWNDEGKRIAPLTVLVLK
jgi:hypothetical protein